MRRWRNKSRAMIAAQRFCLAVVLFAGVNWLLNVFHYHWLIRSHDIQVGTWLGSLEVQWFTPSRFPPAPKTRFFFGAGGVTGPSGLATVLSHIHWLPHYGQYDFSGQLVTSAPMGAPPGPPDHSRLLLPMWSVGILSGVPYILLTINARRRRRARLCDVCDYSLIGLPPGPDGLTTCPECGSRAHLSESPNVSSHSPKPPIR